MCLPSCPQVFFKNNTCALIIIKYFFIITYSFCQTHSLLQLFSYFHVGQGWKNLFYLYYITTNNYGYIQIYNIITMYYLSNLSNFNYLQIPLSLTRANESCSTSKYLITRSKSNVSTWNDMSIRGMCGLIF